MHVIEIDHLRTSAKRIENHSSYLHQQQQECFSQVEILQSKVQMLEQY